MEDIERFLGGETCEVDVDEVNEILRGALLYSFAAAAAAAFTLVFLTATEVKNAIKRLRSSE